MRAYKILPVEIKVKDFKLSKQALVRLSWMDWYFSHQENAEATCRHFSLSKSVFYRWKSRFNKYDLTTLEFNTKLRRPHKLREMTTPVEVIKRIYDIRYQNPWMSKYEIEEQLKREGIKISRKPIEKVIKRHSELHNTHHIRKIKQKRVHKIARIKASKEIKGKDLGSLIQIDTKHLYILSQRFYVFVAIDCKSRLGFTYTYKSCNSSNAADFLQKVIDYFPFKISGINTDNGSEYLLNFHKLTEELNIPHYFNHPHTPKMNARAERLIQTLEYEFLDYKDDLLPEIEYVRSICVEFNDYYNKKRFHRALHYQTPQEYVTNYLDQKGEQPFSI
jgi:transposase InsO family protein